jgi:hypothetical protein
MFAVVLLLFCCLSVYVEIVSQESDAQQDAAPKQV